MNKRLYLLRAGILLLALVLLATSLLACGEKKGPAAPDPTTEPPTETNGEGTTTDPADLSEEARFAPQAVNFNNETFTIMATSRNRWGTVHWVSDDTDGTDNVINDALLVRETIMSETYGVDLVYKQTDIAPDTALINAAGDQIANLVHMTGRQSMYAAQKGILNNLFSLDPLNLEASYYDQRIQTEYQVLGKLFAVEGDFSTWDEMVTMVILYNDKVYQDHLFHNTHGSLYDLVNEREWTYSTMMEMAKAVTADTDGVEGMSADDTWGFVTERQAPFYFYLGSGKKAIVNTGSELELNILNDKANIINILQKTIGMADDKDILIAEDIPSGDVWTIASNIFENDRALYRSTSLSAAVRLGEMYNNYGILPIPLWTEGQENYYCWQTATNSAHMTIPVSVKDAEKTAQIAEILAYISRYGSDTLYNAFFSRMIIAHLCRSQNDREMLQLIFASKAYDTDNATRIVDVYQTMFDLVKNHNTSALSSELDKNINAAKEKLQQVVVDITSHAPN